MSVRVITHINKPFAKHMFECKGSHLQALILQSFLFTVYEIVKQRSCFVNVYCIMYNYQYALKKLFRSFNHAAENKPFREKFMNYWKFLRLINICLDVGASIYP